MARGTPLSRLLYTEEEVLDAIEGCILFFKEYGIDGERFNDTLKRVGFEKAEELILSKKLINRREEIISG